MTKVNFLLVPVFLLISGCTTYTWVHPERNEAAMQADYLRCESLALQMHPRNYQRYQTAPATKEPDTTTCTTEGNRTRCVTETGKTRPARYSQRDINIAPRNSAFERCMGSMGYTRVEVK